MRPDPAEIEGILREWQGPLYNLAFRTLGNEHDAADASQEVFLTLFRNFHRYDRAHPLRPWIYTVANRALLNFLRKKRRQERAASSAQVLRDRTGGPAPTGQPELVRAEEQEIVARALGELPGPVRLLLLLRYQHDVPQSELAVSFGVARASLQERLQRGLELLRVRLAAMGLPAMCVPIEESLRTLPPVQVPPSLSIQLAQQAIAAQSATSGLLPLVPLGVLAMSKKTLVIAVASSLLFAAAGVWGGRRLSHGDLDSARAAAELAERGSVAREKELAGEIERLEAERSRLQHELAAAAAAEDAHRSVAAQHSAAEEAAAGGELEASAPAGATDASDIDWNRLSEAVADNVDLVHGRLAGGDAPPMTPDDQVRLMKLLSELTDAASRARELSPYPFLDAQIFPELTKALFGKALELSPEQLEALDRIAREALARELDGADPADKSPLERSVLRDRLLDAVQEEIRTILVGEQASALERVAEVVEHLLSGSRRILRVDISGWEDGRVEDLILKEWRSVFGYAERDLGRFRPVATRFLGKVRKILQDYASSTPAGGSTDATPAPAVRAGDGDSFSMPELEMIRAQTSAELEILALLTPEELERVGAAIPVYLLFNESGRGSRTERHLPGF